MIPYMVSYYGNPHSRSHAYGWETEAAVEKARKVTLFETFIFDNILEYFRTLNRHEPYHDKTRLIKTTRAL